VVKKRRPFKFDEVRQRFRLTATEIRVATFVAAAFVLGLITKWYRDAHRSPTPVEIHSKAMTSMSTSTNAHKKRATKLRDSAGRPSKSEEKLDLSDSATKQEHQQK
jgi:hypothetical protein